MEINFTNSDEKKNPVLEDVEKNQFFIDKRGQLCQKTGDCSYVLLANKEGIPFSNYICGIEREESIQKILPKVTKINF